MARKLVNEFTWSGSRDKLFRTCKRAYYYNYYGSWGGWEADASEKTRFLYLLKNITTMEMWAGSIVHAVIAESLNRFTQKGSMPKTGELQARAREKLRSGWIEAVNREWEEKPKKTNIFDLYYGNGKTVAKERTDAIRARVYDCLAAFAESDILKEILCIDYMNWKPVDKLDSFNIDGLKIWCAIDFAFTDPAGILRIIDWKTGSENKDDLNIQLGCYAFYANQKWFTDPSKIRMAGVFLRENSRVSEYPILPETMVAARDFILQSAMDMRELLRDPAHNIAEEEDFPVAADNYPCRFCQYQQACPKIEK